METYQLALDMKSITHVGLHHALQEMLTSHARRSDLLRDRIQRWGGEPPTGSGGWGAFAKAIQAGANLFGDRVAVAALEEGEERAVRLYTEDLGGCDPRTRTFLETEAPARAAPHPRALPDPPRLPGRAELSWAAGAPHVTTRHDDTHEQKKTRRR